MCRNSLQKTTLALAAALAMLVASTPLVLAETPAPTQEASEAAKAGPQAEPEIESKSLRGGFHGLTLVRADDGTTDLQRQMIGEELREILAERLAASPFAPAPGTPEKVVLANGMERLRLGVDGISFAVVRLTPNGETVASCAHGPEAATAQLEAKPETEPSTKTSKTEIVWVEE